MRGEGNDQVMKQIEFDYSALQFSDPLAFKLLEFARYNSLNVDGAMASIVRVVSVQGMIKWLQDHLVHAEHNRLVLRVWVENGEKLFGFFDAKGNRYVGTNFETETTCNHAPKGDGSGLN